MSTHRIHVFISHSWKYSNDYDTLVEWIFEGRWRSGQASLVFLNYSVPKDNPIHHASSDRELKDAIYRKIARCHVVIIPSGMYVNYSKWIKKEIEGATEKEKPILAVDLWGQRRASSVVGKAADERVGWNRSSVVRGIWKLYRR